MGAVEVDYDRHLISLLFFSGDSRGKSLVWKNSAGSSSLMGLQPWQLAGTRAATLAFVACLIHPGDPARHEV